MKIRTTCPSNNKYYIMQSTGGLNGAVKGVPTQPTANVLDNCVGYANGRFNEICNDPELEGIVKAFPYQLVCNAEDFIESAKRKGLKISNTPTLGGVMVWQKGRAGYGGDGAGHVAVVEQINENGSIVTSESGWNAWAFKLVTRPNDGRWGQNSSYKFRGCIINPRIGGGTIPTEQPIEVDGIGGGLTVMLTQRFFNMLEDGIISGQVKAQKKWYPNLIAVEFGGGGSPTIKAMQKWLGIAADGVWGHDTSVALQAYLKREGYYDGDEDGIFGYGSMCGWQNFLNKQIYHVDPSGGGDKGDYTMVVDVSEFQSAIDWDKVKADGIKGAIIRCAGRGAETGNLYNDSMFLDHISRAHKAGVKVGVYFFSEAINEAEGREEARVTLDLVKSVGIPLDYPIGVDSENVTWKNEDGSIGHGRANSNKLSTAKRTEAIGAFCDEIQKNGYKAMIYASTTWLNNQLDMSKLPYYVWVAQWGSVCQYKGEYIIWQYTNNGVVKGIKKKVDMNKCYYNGGEPTPPPTPTPEPTPKKYIEEDGIAGKATIERAQTVFGTLVDGIVSGQRKDLIKKYCPSLRAVAYNKVRSTLVQAIQRWAGVKDDGIWGKDTSIAVQNKLLSEGYDVGPWGADGIFATASMKGFQKWLNEHDSPTPKPEPKPEPTPEPTPSTFVLPTVAQIIEASNFGMMLRATIWAEDIANGNKYGYRPYDSKHTECYLCHPELMPKGNKVKLSNCIGWAAQFWHHGAGIVAMKCSQNWVNNAKLEKALTMSDAECLAFFKKATGLTAIRVLRNGGKSIPWDRLKRGMICFYFNGKKYEHTYPYIGDKMMIDSGGWSDWNKQIAKRSCAKKQPKIAIEYTGGLSYLQKYDRGEAVKLLQIALNILGGYGLTEDGIFGDGTETAVKDFQSKHGLDADGLAGEKTFAKMAELRG